MGTTSPVTDPEASASGLDTQGLALLKRALSLSRYSDGIAYQLKIMKLFKRDEQGRFVSKKTKIKVYSGIVVLIGILAFSHFYVEPWIDRSIEEMKKVEAAMSNEVVAHADTVRIVEKDVRTWPKALQAICNAESGGKHLKPNGRVIRGHVNPSDIGLCQINEPIWNDKAREMGFDIFTEEGNKAMALWLFDNYGTEPWNASKAGWIKKLGE